MLSKVDYEKYIVKNQIIFLILNEKVSHNRLLYSLVQKYLNT